MPRNKINIGQSVLGKNREPHHSHKFEDRTKRKKLVEEREHNARKIKQVLKSLKGKKSQDFVDIDY